MEQDLRYKVLEVDITRLPVEFCHSQMLSQLFKFAIHRNHYRQSVTPDSEIDVTLFERQQITLYSLFMQQERGDADEFAENKEDVPEIK